MQRNYSVDTALIKLKNFITHHLLTPKKNTVPVNRSMRDDFENNYVINMPKNFVREFTLPIGERKMHYHQLNTQENNNQPHKKALIFFMSSEQYIALSLPVLELILRKLNNESTLVTGFCMDYRGRGYNSECPQEDFTHYTYDRDVEDYAVLIKKLMADGFHPEDIIFYGEEYGERVALWLLHELTSKDQQFAQIKVLVKSGYGSLADESFITQLESKKNSLISNSIPDALNFKKITGLKEHHFLQALLMEKPIVIAYPYHLPNTVYQLKQNPQTNDPDSIPLTTLPWVKHENADIECDAVNTLVKQLHRYCEDRAKSARESHTGGEYKRNYFFTSPWGWTARSQVTQAVQIMNCLCKSSPQWNEIIAIAASTGPHKTGVLSQIFDDVLQLAKENLTLIAFNDTACRPAKTGLTTTLDTHIREPEQKPTICKI